MTDASALPLPNALSLEGKTIAITGAASGIGRATAHVVAQLGAALLLTDRAPLDALQAELAGFGPAVRTLQADMAEPGFAGRLLGLGTLHGLAHCAAIYAGTPLRDDADPTARFARMMDINVRVPVELGTACMEQMAASDGGAVVLLGSLAGRNGGSTSTTAIDYAAAKGAVHTAVRWLSRRGVGRGVRVNGVAPGPVATPMTAGLSFELAALPMGRMGEPEEIAWVIAFLLSGAASYISGAIFDVNGGTFVG